MTEEIRQKLTGAVIGLARTCENNEKTEHQPGILRSADDGRGLVGKYL